MIACAILAAGASRRLGRPKQLVPVFGVPLVRRIAAAALASSCEEVAVVVGAAAADVAGALGGLPLTLVANHGWAEGIASSIRAAATWGARTRCDALVLLLCDQPRLDAAHVDRLVAAHANGARVVASAYAGVRGAPALFAREWLPALRALEGDRGAGALLARARDVTSIVWPDGALDLDTETDLAHV